MVKHPVGDNKTTALESRFNYILKILVEIHFGQENNVFKNVYATILFKPLFDNNIYSDEMFSKYL